MPTKKPKAEPMGKRAQVLKRGKNKVPIHGEQKTSPTGPPGNNPRAIAKLGEPRLISFEKNSDGTATLRAGRGTVALLEGLDDVKEWSDSELLQGHRNNVRRPPNIVPMGVYLELVNRVMSRARFYFVAELEVALSKHIQIINNIDPTDRENRVTMVEWMAIKEVYERVMGPPEQKVTIGLDKESWQSVIANALVPSSSDIIDVKPEDPDDDDPIDAAV